MQRDEDVLSAYLGSRVRCQVSAVRRRGLTLMDRMGRISPFLTFPLRGKG